MRFAWDRAVRIAGVAGLLLMASACNRDAVAVSPGELETNARAAEAFLATNAKAPGIITLASGLQYRVVTAAPGGASPDRNDLVRVDYEGALIDGTVFDSSFQKGVPYATTPEDVVPGWTEALQKMKVGEEWMLYVPPELGYGKQRAGHIPPNSVLVFRIKLLDMLPVAGAGGRGPGVANG